MGPSRPGHDIDEETRVKLFAARTINSEVVRPEWKEATVPYMASADTPGQTSRRDRALM